MNATFPYARLHPLGRLIALAGRRPPTTAMVPCPIPPGLKSLEEPACAYVTPTRSTTRGRTGHETSVDLPMSAVFRWLYGPSWHRQVFRDDVVSRDFDGTVFLAYARQVGLTQGLRARPYETVPAGPDKRTDSA